MTYCCSLLYQLLGRLRNRRTYGFRYVIVQNNFPLARDPQIPTGI
jgi:hypothetical protein